MRLNSSNFAIGVAALSLLGVFVPACNDSGSSTGDACGIGTELCGDVCVSTAVDPGNCGACGNACGAGEACDSGACVFACGGETTNCNQSCVDTRNDPANCGGCGNACDAEQEVCSGGQCAAICGAGGMLRCGDACVDTMNDSLNCGACGSPCAAGEACDAGSCVIQTAPKAVYTMTNDPAGNKILSFGRGPDGTLSPEGTFVATGGRGSGGGLGNQHGLIFDSASNRFFVVNAGDSTISMLSLRLDGGLDLLDNVPSGGERPISITADGDVVYVLNAGVTANGTESNITGFRIMGDTLSAIANSTQPLSAPNPGPAQIQFSPDGTALVVTEKGTNMLSSYAVDAGVASAPIVTASAGMTPFGFDFHANGYLIVSEAAGGADNASTASSYMLDAMANLTPVSPAVPTTRSAACWLVVAGDYAYVTNAKTNDVTGFQIAADGSLSLLDANGVTGQTGAGPVDEDVTDDDDFLYVVNNGDKSFSIFQINADGSLTKQPDFMGLPSTANGVVAR